MGDLSVGRRTCRDRDDSGLDIVNHLRQFMLHCNIAGAMFHADIPTSRRRPPPQRRFEQTDTPMLKGKTAVVTGSTSGIGLGIARALAGEGANVVLNGFGDANEIEKIRASVEKECGVKAAYSPADMTKPAEIAAMIKTAEQTFGSVDILINNAGIQHVAPIEEFPIEKWDQIIAIDLSSAFHSVRAAALQREVDLLAACRAAPRHEACSRAQRRQQAVENLHCAVQPPSIERLAPVTEDAASEHR